MFSANQTISSSGLKFLDVVRRRRNGIGRGGTGSDRKERGQTRLGTRSDGRNGVGQG